MTPHSICIATAIWRSGRLRGWRGGRWRMLADGSTVVIGPRWRDWNRKTSVPVGSWLISKHSEIWSHGRTWGLLPTNSAMFTNTHCNATDGSTPPIKKYGSSGRPGCKKGLPPSTQADHLRWEALSLINKVGTDSQDNLRGLMSNSKIRKPTMVSGRVRVDTTWQLWRANCWRQKQGKKR